MNSSLWTVTVFVSLLVASCLPAFACEDEHPPVAVTPAESFVIPDDAGGALLSLTIDPRGIGGVALAGEAKDTWIDQDDSSCAWHYREWQWWKGHPWGDSCRPRYYAEVALRRVADDVPGADLNYHIDGFACRQTFLLPAECPADAPYWDLVTTIRNETGNDVAEYGQFFACYTPLNRRRSFCFWDESGELVLFADRGVTHLDGYVAHPNAYFVAEGAIPHCPRGGGKVVGQWHRPVIVSHASPAGWRSVVLIEPKYAAALAHGIHGGAMDYILFPGPDQRKFADGDEFSAHLRHVMLRSPELPTRDRLEALWGSFESARMAVHERARRFAESD